MINFFKNGKSHLITMMTFALLAFYFSGTVAAAPQPLPNSSVQLGEKFEWTKADLFELGHIPDEVIVKFKEEAYDLREEEGQQKSEAYILDAKEVIASNVLQQLAENGRLDSKENSESARQLFSEEIFTIKENLKFANLSVLKLSTDNIVNDVVNQLEALDNVEYAEPNYVTWPLYAPNESNYDDGQLWGLHNDGSLIIKGDAENSPSYSTNNEEEANNSDKDINASDAWNMLSGSESTIIVAVLDTGIDYTHTDLDGVMWDGTNCVDENGDALGGCSYGYDYANDDPNPDDDNDHGTHVAGIIGAEHSESDIGILGVSKNVELMAVKVLNSSGTIIEKVKGIQFAKENGAKIINASYGYATSSASEEDAIEAFVDNGSLGGIFVAAAGNSADDLDSGGTIYPAAYDLDSGISDNLITVAGTDQADEAYNSSNYGATSVDLGAPAVNILSTIPGDLYDLYNGTSMAAPFVTGTAAMIWGYRSELTAQQVKLAIMESGDDVSELHPSTGSFPTATGKRLNAYEALLATEGALVVPTIKSITGSGNWSSTSTWVGGVVPVSTNVVEIDGTVTLNGNKTVAGLIVNSGKTLRSHASNTYTLTLSGANADLENNGTLNNYSSGDINLIVGGNLENNGTFAPNTADVAGNLVNTGTISVNTYVEGLVRNTGTITSAVQLDGSTDQTIEGSGTFGYLTISNNAEVISDITLSYSPTILTGKTLTITTGKTLTTNGGLFNSGTISGGKIKMNGAGNQNISGAGPLNIDELWLADGTTRMYTNVDLNGDLKVSLGATLRPNNSTAKPNYTMDVSGNVDNDGTIKSYKLSGSNYGELDLTVAGNIDNSGSILYEVVANSRVDVEGDLTNSGTISEITNVAGDVNNTGTTTLALIFDGTSAQTLSGAGTFGSITISNDTSTTSNISTTSSLSVSGGDTFTIGNTYTFTANGGLYNSGTLTGDTFKFNGANQYLGACGTIDLTSISIDNGTTRMNTDCELTADVTVETGATLQPNSVHRTLTIHGDLTVNGTTQDYSGDRLYIYLDSDLDNNGTMNHYRTYADWEPVGGADSYEFQLTDISDVWQTEVSTGTNTHSLITAYETDDRRWRWRSIEDSTPSAWSSDKYIN